MIRKARNLPNTLSSLNFLRRVTSRDRKGAVFEQASQIPLPHGRGSFLKFTRSQNDSSAPPIILMDDV
jgi:hypothetical protein